MKKILFLMLLVFLVSFGAALAADNCTETDSEDLTLMVDEIVSFNSQKVQLLDVASSSVIIEVDNMSEIISVGDTEEVEGLSITINSVNSTTERENSSASITISCAEEEEEETTESSTVGFTFEYDSSIDLSDYNSTLSSVQGIHVQTSDNLIVLNSIPALGTKKVEHVWLYTPEGVDVYANGTQHSFGKVIGVFYTDPADNQVKLYTYVDAASTGDVLMSLWPGDTEYEVTTQIAPRFARKSLLLMNIGDEITLSWGASTSMFESLGRTLATEEANEIRIGTTGVGAETTDQVSSDGIVVMTPATYGASDMVSLEVPTSGSGYAAAPSSDGEGIGVKLKRFWQSLFY